MYYKKIDGEILLTDLGHDTLAFFGLSLEDLKVMTPEQLIAHTKKFSDVLNDGKSWRGAIDTHLASSIYGGDTGKRKKGWSREEFGSYSRYFSLDAWAANALSKTFPFLICPKASKSERNKGCEDLPLKDKFSALNTHNGTSTRLDGQPTSKQQNNHPTVKPLKLLSYLITLGSREGDLVLDPFVGSGTSYLAAIQFNRNCVGIELNPEYLEIAKARIKPLLEQTKLV